MELLNMLMYEYSPYWNMGRDLLVVIALFLIAKGVK